MSKEYDCSCWWHYPNEHHKHKNGKWKCVDDYECIRDLVDERATTSGYELPSPITSEMVYTIPCGIVRHVHSAATPSGKTLRHTLNVV